MNIDTADHSYATKPEGSIHIQTLLEQMLSQGKYQWLGEKKHIYFPEDLEFAEALTNACIQLGLSDEGFNPDVIVDGAYLEVILHDS